MFLVHPTLSEAELALACGVIREVFARAQLGAGVPADLPG